MVAAPVKPVVAAPKAPVVEAPKAPVAAVKKPVETTTVAQVKKALPIK